MTMREKIARALYPIDNVSSWDEDPDTWKEVYFKMADAVLDALREPTPEMLICMHDIVRIECSPAKREASILNDADTWRAMIDAAKGETK